MCSGMFAYPHSPLCSDAAAAVARRQVGARGFLNAAAGLGVPMAAAQTSKKTCDVRRFMTDVRAQARGKISVEDVLKAPKFPPEWPYSPADFKRMDESEDEVAFFLSIACPPPLDGPRAIGLGAASVL